MVGARAIQVLLAGAPLVLGCAAGKTLAQNSTTPTHVTVSGNNDRFEWFVLPVEVGKEQGIWVRHGLDPDFVPAAASAAQLEQQVASGIKLGLVNTAEVLLARSEGAAVKIVAGYFGETGAKIYVKADAPWRTAKDLDGRKVGILAKTHTSYRTVAFMNARLGINCEPIVAGNLDSSLAALMAGTIDAFYSAEGAAATKEQVRVVLSLADLYPKPYTAVVAWATEDLIQQDPALVRAFVEATLDSVRFIKEHPGDASRVLARRWNMPEGSASRVVAELNKVLTPHGRGSGQDLLAAVEGNRRFTAESGFPAVSAVHVEDAVNASFLP